MYNYEGEAEDQATMAEPPELTKAQQVAEQNRLDAERWRALAELVKDARYYQPIYLERGRDREYALTEGILRVYGPIFDVIQESVHPDTCTAHTFSRKMWADAKKNGRGVVQWINMLALPIRRMRGYE